MFTPICFSTVQEMVRRLPHRVQQTGYIVLVHLLSEARRKPGVVNGIELKRGDVSTVRRDIPKQIPVSEQEFRTILTHFQKVGFLTQKLTQPNTILSICNFDTYVHDNIESIPESNPELTQKQPRSNPAILEEVVKGKREKSTTMRPARVREETNPLNLTESDLLSPAPDFDEDGCFHHFLDMQRKYHRAQISPLLARHAIKVLHGDPTIEPRLGGDEIKKIMGRWMKSGFPITPQGLFIWNEKYGAIEWEVSLMFAQNDQNKGDPEEPEKGTDFDTFLQQRKEHAP